MLNIVVPMAGRGSRFVNAGISTPKPLIPIHGKTMIELVLNNLKPKGEHKFIFLILKEHIDKFQIDEKLKEFAPGCEIIVVDQVTEGAACTVLLAKDLINNDNPLMIANSDQWIDIDINDYLNSMDEKKAQGLIMTMWANDPKWSFVRLDKKGHVTETVEKQVVSNHATVGIYNYKKGRYFVESAESMISNNFRVNNEFYVAPAYNWMPKECVKTIPYSIGKVMDGMYGLGTPEDLEKFIAHPVSKKATDF